MKTQRSRTVSLAAASILSFASVGLPMHRANAAKSPDQDERIDFSAVERDVAVRFFRSGKERSARTTAFYEALAEALAEAKALYEANRVLAMMGQPRPRVFQSRRERILELHDAAPTFRGARGLADLNASRRMKL